MRTLLLLLLDLPPLLYYTYVQIHHRYYTRISGAAVWMIDGTGALDYPQQYQHHTIFTAPVPD